MLFGDICGGYVILTFPEVKKRAETLVNSSKITTFEKN